MNQLIKEVQRIDVRPGDVIVIRPDEACHVEDMKRLQEELARLFPENRIVVCEFPISIALILGTHDGG